MKENVLNILDAFFNLLDPSTEIMEYLVDKSCQQNPWFLVGDYNRAIHAIRDSYLDKIRLIPFADKYFVPVASPKWIGLVLAGNIPLVGIHDIICVILSGHKLMIKLSDKDPLIYRYLFDEIQKEYPVWTRENIRIVDKLKDFDAVIATGSNNSARYFEHYFGKVPNIIRRNRNGVAVLDGSESEDDIQNFGRDVFTYFGLGCRNVSKIYVPPNYDFSGILDSWRSYSHLMDHSRYRHNYDYNFALQVMNKLEFMTNDAIMLIQERQIPSRIATLHYEVYQRIPELISHLNNERDQIQCICSRLPLDGIPTIPFGQSQYPGLEDYADGIDTMNFLMKIG